MTRKNRNLDWIITVLFLIASIVTNLIQSARIEALIEEKRKLEYTLSLEVEKVQNTQGKCVTEGISGR